MNKAAALYQFFSQFELPVYEENSVYDGDEPPVMPYMTVQLNTGAFDSELNGQPLNVSLWYRSDVWSACNAKSEEISRAIGRHGTVLKCDGGYILIRRNDSNFAQSMGDLSDDMVKRKYINLTVEYFTND